MAPFGFKLWENAFQTIPDISFFEVEIFFLAKFNFSTKSFVGKNFVLAGGHICPG